MYNKKEIVKLICTDTYEGVSHAQTVHATFVGNIAGMYRVYAVVIVRSLSIKRYCCS
jgi:hypothetical protein